MISFGFYAGALPVPVVPWPDEVFVDRNYTPEQLDIEREAVLRCETANSQRGSYPFKYIIDRLE